MNDKSEIVGCAGCIFSLEINEGIVCRRFPPQVVIAPVRVEDEPDEDGTENFHIEPQINGVFPPVHPLTWCAEFQHATEH